MLPANSFHFLHKTLRALLSDTGSLLHPTDVGVANEYNEGAVRLQVVVRAVENCCQATSQHLLPLLTLFEPGIADSVLQDQNEIRQCGKKLLDLIQDDAGLLPLADKRPAGQSLAALFESYRLLCHQYLQREETVVYPLLCRYSTDAELKQSAWEMVRGSGLASPPLLASWLLHELGPGGIDGWPDELKMTGNRQEEPLPANVSTGWPSRSHSLAQKTIAVGALAVEG